MALPPLRHLLAFCITAIAFSCASAAVPAGIAKELQKQLRLDVPEVRECAPKHDFPVNAKEIYLGAEGSPQYLLTALGDCMCGQVNCSEWVYRRGPQKWELILETQGYSFTTRPAVHHGYRDVETRSRDSAARVDTLRYVFDGYVYRAAAAQQPYGQAAGVGKTHWVQFGVGTSSLQLQGSVSPHGNESWKAGARKAQTMRLSLVDHENSAIGFSVLGPPGSNGRNITAFTRRWEGSLPETGTYTVLVEAPRIGVATYTLSIEVR